MLLDNADGVVSMLLVSVELSDVVLDNKDLEYVDGILVDVTVVGVEVDVANVVKVGVMVQMIVVVAIGRHCARRVRCLMSKWRWK